MRSRHSQAAYVALDQTLWQVNQGMPCSKPKHHRRITAIDLLLQGKALCDMHMWLCSTRWDEPGAWHERGAGWSEKGPFAISLARNFGRPLPFHDCPNEAHWTPRMAMEKCSPTTETLTTVPKLDGSRHNRSFRVPSPRKGFPNKLSEGLELS